MPDCHTYNIWDKTPPVVDTYISNQEEHHRVVDFAEEMKKYLGELSAEDVYREWFEEMDKKD